MDYFYTRLVLLRETCTISTRDQSGVINLASIQHCVAIIIGICPKKDCDAYSQEARVFQNSMQSTTILPIADCQPTFNFARLIDRVYTRFTEVSKEFQEDTPGRYFIEMKLSLFFVIRFNRVYTVRQASYWRVTLSRTAVTTKLHTLVTRSFDTVTFMKIEQRIEDESEIDGTTANARAMPLRNGAINLSDTDVGLLLRGSLGDNIMNSTTTWKSSSRRRGTWTGT